MGPIKIVTCFSFLFEIFLLSDFWSCTLETKNWMDCAWRIQDIVRTSCCALFKYCTPCPCTKKREELQRIFSYFFENIFIGATLVEFRLVVAVVVTVQMHWTTVICVTGCLVTQKMLSSHWLGLWIYFELLMGQTVPSWRNSWWSWTKHMLRLLTIFHRKTSSVLLSLLDELVLNDSVEICSVIIWEADLPWSHSTTLYVISYVNLHLRAISPFFCQQQQLQHSIWFNSRLC